MGTSAARDQRARTRGRVAQIDRAIAERWATDPDRVRQDRRIKAAVADARKSLRARSAAQRADEAAQARAGAAVRRLLDEGLSLSDVAVLLNLPRNGVKRLMRHPAEAGELAGTDH
jgi:hypothetical protein